MSSLLSLLRAGDELLSRVVRAICVVAMASIFIMFILNVFVRFVPIYNFTQTDDWIQFALVWMIFLGAQELVRTRNHFVVDLFTDRLRDRLSGTVVLCFQPAEEVGKGAAAMIADGALEGVDAAFGIHVWSDVPTGHVAVRTGPMMAAGDEFEIEVFGKAGHGAMPHCCSDATLMASAIALNLQTIVSRETDPIDTAVVTVGMLNSGTRFNVISGYAKLIGTTRCFKPEIRARFPEQLERIAKETARAMNGDAKLTYNALSPPTFNDADMAERVRVAAKKLLGENALYDYPPSMGGEDFAYYQEKVPGAMCFLGVRNEACGAVYAQHHNCYQVDEAMLVKGALLHAQMAVDYLGLECQ